MTRFAATPHSNLRLGVLAGACLLAILPGCLLFEDDSCVAEGTLVDTVDGRRSVETLAVGDIVYAVDPATGIRVATALTAVRSARRECVELEFGSDAALRCTPDHPLYDPDEGIYAPAGEWATGRRTRLLHVTEDGVQPVMVRARLAYVGLFTVFDLTVADDLHNFVAGGILVHNKSDYCEPEPYCYWDTDGPETSATSTTTSTTSTTSTSSTTSPTDGTSGETDTGGDTDSGPDTDGDTDSGSSGGTGTGTDGGTDTVP